jgi:mannose-1-phosphate guanylyltransferase
MKSGQIFTQLSSTIPNKYIPTPEAASIILNFFIYNNFQDFNTWQQIARTKIDYDYFENSKGSHVCKVVLKWDDRTFPTFI